MASNLPKLLFIKSIIRPKFYQKNNYSTLPDNLRRNYERFQRDDGLPVHLKGGLGDRLLLGATLGVLFIGLLGTGDTLYRLYKK